MKAYKISPKGFNSTIIPFISLVNKKLVIKELIPQEVSDEDGKIISVNGSSYYLVSESTIDLEMAANVSNDHSVLMQERQGLLVNVFANTVATKQTMQEFSVQAKNHAVAQLFQPFGEEGIDGIVLGIPVGLHGQILFEGDKIDLDETVFISFEQAVSALMPSLKIDSVVRDGDLVKATVALTDSKGTVVNKNATAYIESTVGSVLTPRVSISNGVGQARIFVGGLEAGTVGKLKAGFKHYTGKEEVLITV